MLKGFYTAILTCTPTLNAFVERHRLRLVHQTRARLHYRFFICGRYRLSRRKQLVEEYFGAVSGDDDWNPRYNIAPTQPSLKFEANEKAKGVAMPGTHA